MTPSEIQHSLRMEQHIVWLHAVDELPRYVRQSFTPDTGDDPVPGVRHTDSVRLVGYSVVENSRVGTPRTHRRVFWLKKGDPYERGAPDEAVDPSTVRPGTLGHRPEDTHRTPDQEAPLP